LWLHGPRRSAAKVQIVWRADFADELDASRCEELLTACRPSALEAVTIPLSAARDWLRGEEVSASISDVIAASAPEEINDWGKRDQEGRRAFRWNGGKGGWIEASAINPGDVLVVPASRGGLGADSFDPQALESVTDLGDLAHLRGRGIASLRLSPGALRCWGLDQEAEKTLPMPEDGETASDAKERVALWVSSHWPESPSPAFCGTSGEWKAARSAFLRLRRRPLIVNGQFLLRQPLSREELGYEAETEDALTEDDDSSFRERQVTLRRHSIDVRDYARRFATSAGFSETLVADVARGLAPRCG